MPEYLHKPTLRLHYSLSEAPDQSSDYVEIARADFNAWNAIPLHYRKLSGDTVVEMDAGEKAAVDAQRLSDARDAIAARLDGVEDELRAFALAVLDEVNLHAERVTAILDASDAAVSLADFKARMGLIDDVPTRTISQMKAAVRGKLGG